MWRLRKTLTYLLKRDSKIERCHVRVSHLLVSFLYRIRSAVVEIANVYYSASTVLDETDPVVQV